MTFDTVKTELTFGRIQEGAISGFEVEATSVSEVRNMKSTFSVLVADGCDMVAVNVVNDDQGTSSAGMTKAVAREFFTHLLAQLADDPE